MKILCSSCGQAHLIDNPANGRTLDCVKCGRPVKVIICPECRAVYSITYSDLISPGYRMSCRKCSASFTVNFSAEYALQKKTAVGQVKSPPLPSIANNRPGDKIITKTQVKAADSTKQKGFWQRISRSGIFSSRKRGLTPSPGSDPSVPSALKKPYGVTDPPLSEPVSGEKRSMSPKSPAGEGSPGRFMEGGSDPGTRHVSLSQFLERCGSFFTLPNLLITAAGISASLTLSAVIAKISSAVRAEGIVSDLLLTMSWFIVLAGYAVTASLLCLRERGRKGSMAESAIFLYNSAIMAMLLFVGLALTLSGVSALVSLIPLVGPVLFALLFLPAYAAFIVLGVVGVVSFWFYPPVTAAAGGRMAGGLKGLFGFTIKNKFRLIYLIFIISAVSALIGGLLYAANYVSIKLCVTFLGGLVPEEAAKVYASIPPGMHRFFDAAQAGTDIGTMKLFMESLLASHQLAGIILGTAITLVSLFMISSFVICLSALSFQAHSVLEKGDEIDERALLRLLGILFSILGIIYLLRLLLR